MISGLIVRTALTCATKETFEWDGPLARHVHAHHRDALLQQGDESTGQTTLDVTILMQHDQGPHFDRLNAVEHNRHHDKGVNTSTQAAKVLYHPQ